MDGTLVGICAFAAVLGLLAIRVPIAFALAGVATVGTFVIFAFRTGAFTPDRALKPTTSLVFSNSFDLIHSYDLSMIPLFIALGHIAYRAEITTKIYDAARVWRAFRAAWRWPRSSAAAAFRRSPDPPSPVHRPWGASAAPRCCAWDMTNASPPRALPQAVRSDR